MKGLRLFLGNAANDGKAQGVDLDDLHRPIAEALDNLACKGRADSLYTAAREVAEHRRLSSRGAMLHLFYLKLRAKGRVMVKIAEKAQIFAPTDIVHRADRSYQLVTGIQFNDSKAVCAVVEGYLLNSSRQLGGLIQPFPLSFVLKIHLQYTSR